MIKIYGTRSQLDYDPNMFCMLLILNALQNPKFEYVYTNVDIMMYFLFRRKSETVSANRRDRTIITRLKRGMQLLYNDSKYKVEQFGNNYIFYASTLTIDVKNESFFIIEYTEIQEIFKSGSKPFELLRFFCRLIDTLAYGAGTGHVSYHMSQDLMSELWGMSKQTIRNYLQELENMKLIYIYRPNARRTDGTMFKLNNVYGRYIHKDKIIAEAKAHQEDIQKKQISKSINRTSIKLKYNAFCDGAKKYQDAGEVAKLITLCEEYNSSLTKQDLADRDSLNRATLLDMTVFDKFKAKSDAEELY